jgi:hypothetical protein
MGIFQTQGRQLTKTGFRVAGDIYSDHGHEDNASHDQKIEQNLKNQHNLAPLSVII